jgi:hypothetical protein
MQDQADNGDMRRSKRSRLERIKTRLDQVNYEREELRPLVGVVRAIVDLLEDEL